MKIAIHHTEGSFSEGWIAYCNSHKIPWKKVNCHASDIVHQVKDCNILMWNFHQSSSKDFLFAKQLLFSLQSSGMFVFPDINTCWHFDDKLGQKYLLESIGAPLIPSYVFYDKKSANEWISNAVFPKVFKLRCGAASSNVKLVKTRYFAKHLVRKAFRRGFSKYGKFDSLKERIRRYKEKQTDLYDVFKGIMRLFYTTRYSRFSGRERGYVYFQDFVPDNTFDLRVIVVGNRAYSIIREVRKNDFRASGSGHFTIQDQSIDTKVIKIAFDVSAKLKTQSVAFDFLYLAGEPVISEISYGFPLLFSPVKGYWDSELKWHKGNYSAQAWMVEDIIHFASKREI